MAYWPIRLRRSRLSGGLDSLLARNALCWYEETSAHLQKHVPPFITIYRLPFFAFQPIFCAGRQNERNGAGPSLLPVFNDDELSDDLSGGGLGTRSGHRVLASVPPRFV